MELAKARELAAQAWCTPENESKIMDTELAEAFAEILVKASQRLKQIPPSKE